ncbi:hypothetical protein MMC34_007773 [Xylographa carneopallida]|nr:hypothetical protein [Xylographa carneopallida]
MVSHLLDLPYDILLYVLSVTANADLDNLTSTCKVLSTLASKVLRDHQERKRRYAKVVYDSPRNNTDKNTWIHPSIMLHDFLAQDLFCYPTEIFINDRAITQAAWEDRDGYLAEVQRAEECFDQDFGPLVRACPYLNGDESLVEGVLEDKTIGALLGFLIVLLPNLNALHLIDIDELADGSNHMNSIFKNVLHVGYEPDNPALEATPPLSKLRKITMTCCDGYIRGDRSIPFMYVPLLNMPSIRSVRADRVELGDRWSYPGFGSNIEKLVLNNVDIDIEDLGDYIVNTTKLRYVRCYFSIYYAYEPDRGFYPRRIVQILKECAIHSLRTLELGTEFRNAKASQGGAYFIGSLRDFQALETIVIGRPMCIQPLKSRTMLDTDGDLTTRNRFPVTPGRPLKLVDMLPQSAIRVVLRWECTSSGDGVDADVAVAVLQDLVEKKAELLPNLKLVEFEFARSGFRDEDQALLMACRNFGVEIKYHEFRIDNRTLFCLGQNVGEEVEYGDESLRTT